MSCRSSELYAHFTAQISVEVKGRLEHAISHEQLPEWKTTSDLLTAIDVDMGDYVVYDDWVGQVRVYALRTTGGRC